MKERTAAADATSQELPAGYAGIHSGIVGLLDRARRSAARSINAVMTASYWAIGPRIVEAEQDGQRRAGYGEQLIERLSRDLTQRYGRGFSRQNLQQMRAFFLKWQICQTVSGEFGPSLVARTYPASTAIEAIAQRPDLSELTLAFNLPWSAYVRLLTVKDDHVRHFYEVEALRGGWSVRQLDRQIGSQFYERTALSKDKAAMLSRGSPSKPSDAVHPANTFKDPFILEFLDLKDEYSESDMEAALDISWRESASGPDSAHG